MCLSLLLFDQQRDAHILADFGLPRLLLEALPNWVEILGPGDGAVAILARPPSPDGSVVRDWRLVIGPSKRGGSSVRESVLGAQLPKCCPERHINEDGSFCTQLDSDGAIFDVEAAHAWWRSLKTFLVHQINAETTGLWPVGAQFSHGFAADVQLDMEKIALPLGWIDELLEGIFRHRGWLGNELLPLAKGHRGKPSHVANSRTACPRGCRKTASGSVHCMDVTKQEPQSGKPTLRTDCPHRIEMEQLIMLEHKRRRLEKLMIVEVVQRGVKCCDTMLHCPIKEQCSKISAT